VAPDFEPAFLTSLPEPQFCRPPIAFNYAQCAQNGIMHTAEDTLLPGSISTHAAKAFPSSIYKLKAEGRKHKNIPLPTR
jgi:hypothetical protein